MSTREGAENPGVLRRPVVNFHNVVKSGLEEGELAEDHWGKRTDSDIRRL